MDSRIVIVAYKPKPGKDMELQKLLQDHHSRLMKEGLVTDRKPVLMKGRDGTIVEVFEWKSSAAIEAAHSNPEVGKMWTEFEAVCDYVPLNQVPETSDLFAEFSPIK